MIIGGIENAAIKNPFIAPVMAPSTNAKINTVTGFAIGLFCEKIASHVALNIIWDATDTSIPAVIRTIVIPAAIIPTGTLLTNTFFIFVYERKLG